MYVTYYVHLVGIKEVIDYSEYFREERMALNEVEF
jgi:hypothetical protein